MEVLRAALGAQYTVERLLGQGGMGSVYLARDITLDRQVAIKVINPEVSRDPTLRARFLQEARTVARLRHPNIVPVYAASESAGVLFFVMEYVPGESLRDLMAREGKLTGERMATILRELSLALDHAHKQGLIHRDVKPENILLDADSGRAMLTDFGVARAVERDGGMTQAGMILGSPRYMSPEQASGDDTIDGRSDLYSLALVGYEMCTGAPVVQSSTVAGMLVKHLTETPPPLAQAASNIPELVAQAVDRGLAKDPAKRWQTGRAFAAALAGGSLTPTGELLGIPAPARRRRTAWSVGAGVIVVAAIAWFGYGQRGPDGSGFLVAPFEIQSGDPEVAWLREGSVNMLTLTFGQWSDLNVVDYERTLSLLDAEGLGEKARLSLDDALALARRAKAGTVVTGQIQTTTDSLLVIARLFDVRSGASARQTQVASARGADPRPLFDQLAQQLLDIEGGRTSTMQLAEATTTNLEAYRLYLEGVRHLNSWRLAEADAAFARATALDSTFALAFHKRSLGLGWSGFGGVDYVATAERAYALADRLPPRERSLVEGHYHLTMALTASNTADTATARREFGASIAAYTGLISRGDSLVAEAWNGLADAYFHGTNSIPNQSTDSIRTYATRSLRGFHRTLAIDSTFHLAYSHLVQLYNQAGQNSNLLIDGDSIIVFTDEAGVARLGGATGIQRYRDAANRRGIEIARAWARADTGSTQPILQLVQSYNAASLPDSALAVIRQALARPSTATPTIWLSLLSQQVARADSAMVTTLAHVLSTYPADSLRDIPIGARMPLLASMLTASAMLGRGEELTRSAALMVEANPFVPFSTTSIAPMVAIYERALQVAMGDTARMSRADWRALARQLRGLGTMPGIQGQQVRNGYLSVVYLGFMVTSDTAFQSLSQEWNGGNALTEFDALLALERGDTAAARRLAQDFVPADSLRNPAVRFGVGGMRSVARAEVLAAVGMTREAVETLEATDLARVNQPGLAEPGLVIWTRAWMARARLWTQLGDTPRAIAAYEQFLRYWDGADGAAAAEVRQARLELGRLRDAPR